MCPRQDADLAHRKECWVAIKVIIAFSWDKGGTWNIKDSFFPEYCCELDVMRLLTDKQDEHGLPVHNGHSFLPRLYDDFTLPGTKSSTTHQFMVMKVQGPNLRRFTHICSGPWWFWFTTAVVRKFLFCILTNIAYLHAENVIHCRKCPLSQRYLT